MTKIRVERCARTSSSSLGWMALQIDGRTGACDAGPLGSGIEFVEPRHVVERDFDAQVEALGLAGIDDGDGAVGGAAAADSNSARISSAGSAARPSCGGVWRLGAAEEARDFVQRPLGGGKSDALQLAAAEGFQALEREREVAAALGGHKGVDLIEDDGLDGAQHFARVRGEQQVDGFRRGDQDVGGAPREARALGGGRVAGADGDGGLVEGDARGAGGLRDADQRGLQVAFDIDGERLDGRDVEDAAAFVARRARARTSGG